MLVIFVDSVPWRNSSLLLIGFVLIVGRVCTVAGRESEYMRGFMVGVGSMLALVSIEGKVLDKSNITDYARDIINRQLELERMKNAPH